MNSHKWLGFCSEGTQGQGMHALVQPRFPAACVIHPAGSVLSTISQQSCASSHTSGVQRIHVPRGQVAALAVHPAGTFLAAADDAGEVHVFDLREVRGHLARHRVACLPERPSWVPHVAMWWGRPAHAPPCLRESCGRA